MSDPTNPIPYRLRDSTSKLFDVEKVRKTWGGQSDNPDENTSRIVDQLCDEIERLRITNTEKGGEHAS